MKQINVKRAYDPTEKFDGKQILVDRIWPQGLSKGQANIDVWAKELAPSTDLRKWYQHDPVKRTKFKNRYFNALKNNQSPVDQFLATISLSNVTLLFTPREIKLNNAYALKTYLLSCKSFTNTKPKFGR